MASDPRDYKLDLTGAAVSRGGGGAASESGGARQSNELNARQTAGASGGGSTAPFLSVTFACCGVYARIYRSPDGTRYSGYCPRCARRVRFVVGEGGTSHRSFIVG